LLNSSTGLYAAATAVKSQLKGTTMAGLLQPKPLCRRAAVALTTAALCLAADAQQAANGSDPKALATVRGAVAAQLEADRNDKSNWIYRDHDVSGHDSVYICVSSPQGELRRMTENNGRPVSAIEAQQETQRIAEYVRDPAAQARERKNMAHDDAQATELLKMLPDAFLWTIVSDNAEQTTLSFRPNPKFDGPDMESRVMATMAGSMVVMHKGNHIRTFRGSLTEDFRIGFGILGKLNKGGTFDIERREVGQGYWEITETHVHIGGHALFFKTIGQQQDEVKTDWKPSPAKDLRDAERILSQCCSRQ
jgi:hypothetical protein